MDMTVSKQWWWVRHAPVIDQQGKLYGSADVDCDVTDRASFQGLAAILPAKAYWMTSHLSRTHKTAKAILAEGLKAPKPVQETDLGEQFFGDWQGLSWDEMEIRQPDVYKTFWQAPGNSAPPNGESFADQIKRVGQVIDRVIDTDTGPDIVVVAHGGTIRAALAHALKLSAIDAMSFRIDTLSITRLDFIKEGLLKGKGGSWRVSCVNQSTKPVVTP